MITKVIDNKTLAIVYAIVLFSTLDLALTSYALNSGLAWESNPILRYFSLEGMGILKTLGMVFLFHRFINRQLVLFAVAVILALVCIWNALVIIGSL